MRLIWNKLSPASLVQAARVNKEWSRECSAIRRDKALALVTASETTPDAELSRPQQALRGIQRILRRQNPITGGPFPRHESGCDDDNLIDKCSMDNFSSLKRGVYYFCEEGGGGSGGIGDARVTFEVRWTASFYGPYAAHIYLFPGGLEDCVWMQALLLALTGNFRGLLRAADPSDMPGSPMLCNKLHVKWIRHTSRLVWPPALRRGRPQTKRRIGSYWCAWDLNSD